MHGNQLTNYVEFCVDANVPQYLGGRTHACRKILSA